MADQKRVQFSFNFVEPAPHLLEVARRVDGWHALRRRVARPELLRRACLKRR
jgi:hypothetical protein